MIQRAFAATSCVLFLFTTGCAAIDSSTGATDENEDTGRAQQAILGDTSCPNQNINDPFFKRVENQHPAHGETLLYNPGTGYANNNRQDCPGYATLQGGLITSATEPTITVQYTAIWSGANPGTALLCQNSYLEMATYFGAAGQTWQLDQTVHQPGVWSNNQCTFPQHSITKTLRCPNGDFNHCQDGPTLAAVAVTNLFEHPVQLQIKRID